MAVSEQTHAQPRFSASSHLVLPPNETVRFGLKSKILSCSGTRSPSPPYRKRVRTNKRR